ncbi:uncharacterized protein FOMMEDRAFT_138831 [Fomitiporia mediterranea MF3/22]|uniref:uncharacterized protein n=1 Tax=Fomitiporia mediterranea (strain MF3/22) TaxID=694068 RepID=UPI0004407417|nr:uncharacterized protein FOMMEDRAFT_138831 [Fomitiporia mediterranea MF3/22]EJD05322.1 hypothetical protein FOMMEDRAFT_138831 [Fomitiporia mediterranea MF3/22]
MQATAHQSVSDVANEARALAQSLKEAVKRNEVLDKDVEFKRKSLRKQHLKLLLLYPMSKEAKDAETHIWMQTSYQAISVYKQRLAILDRNLFSPAAQAHKGAAARQVPSAGGHVEYRKMLARFRQFLAEEERFYVQLLVRYQMQFGLTEARSALVEAEVLRPEQEENLQTESGRNVFPEETETIVGENEEREAKLAIFTKLFVCLGDIARYREQYNDGGGRPRAGHEEGPPRKSGRGRGKSSYETIARPRNYSRARVIYEQARLLLPNDGNASHQLAILASYQKDSFRSLLHYYRALCVQHPYDTASDNLNTVLKKALDQYRVSKANQGDDSQVVQKIRVDRFLELVVVLHGLWYLDSDELATRASKHSRYVIAKFRSLISEPALPANVVSDIVVLAFSALWKIRMIRDKNIRANRRVIEPLIATHILSLSRALFDTSRVQLSVKIEDVLDSGDLAQQITAIFRRVLPAIRIASKWLLTNAQQLTKATAASSSPDYYKNSIRAFWNGYVSFLTSLSDSYPRARLPELKIPLDEDVELSGFSPIQRNLFVRPPLKDDELASEARVAHPNEEYLMRISDILKDAEQIATIENSPVSFSYGKFTLSGQPSAVDEPARVATPIVAAPGPPLEPIQPAQDNHEHDEDNDNTTQTSRTDDDVVREAFNEALKDGADAGGDFDEEEDEKIVWSPPKSHLSPMQKIIQPPHMSPLHMSPQAFPSMQLSTASSPTRLAPPATLPPGTTAQDLLNNVLAFSRSKSDQSLFVHQSSTPQASLLFGSGFNSATSSIWSNTSGQLGLVGHVPPSGSQFGPLPVGHERARSQSLSMSQPSVTQSFADTQDSVYQSANTASAALPVGHLGSNFGRLGGRHHHSVSFSGPHGALQASAPAVAPVPSSPPGQVIYDSQLLYGSPASGSEMQDLHMRHGVGYGGQSADPDPFLYYDSRSMNAVGGVSGPTRAGVDPSLIWKT